MSIFDIFAKVLETYMFTEQLETPSPESQQFWLATGRDLRSKPVLVTGHTGPSTMHSTRRPPSIAAPAARRLDGQNGVAH